ncbi:MAG: hypothetical protein PHT32_07035 [Candidatus Omnitrophica bacterium]|nr:hypothetical protein [Candidatus Omnitrophota bacterium]
MARYYHGAKKPKALDCGGPAVCILNPSETRTFKGGRYVDNFKPGLSELYEKKGIAYFYLYLFNFPLSTAKYLRSNKDILWPLIFDVKFSDVIKAAFTRWRIGTPEGAKVFAIKGCGAAKLLEREEWVEFSSMGFNVRLVLFKTLSAFFKKGWCRSAIYVFENQPWEKMLCMASAANNIKAFGYQHSSIWKQYLSQFIGEGESDIAPLPYRIITSSGYFAGLYKEGGIPDGKLAVGGAWRYAHCSDQAARKVPSAGSVAAKPVVMVALPIDRFIAKSMLESVLREVKAKELGAAADFWIKPHPGFLKQDNDMVKAIVSGYPIVSKPFNELLDEVDIVISSASTSGLEAFLYGRKAVAYVAENLLASDPLLDIKDPNVLIWYEGEDLDAGFFRPKSLNSEGMKNKYFDNINQDVWLECANA